MNLPARHALVAGLFALTLGATSPCAADWRRIDSPNFVVVGDVAAPALRNVAMEFEGFREALTGVMTPPQAKRLSSYLNRVSEGVAPLAAWQQVFDTTDVEREPDQYVRQQLLPTRSAIERVRLMASGREDYVFIHASEFGVARTVLGPLLAYPLAADR
jgi:hypothetical protein